MRNEAIKVPAKLIECVTLNEKEKIDCIIAIDWLLYDLVLPDEEFCEKWVGIKYNSFIKALEHLYELGLINPVTDKRNLTWFVPSTELLPDDTKIDVNEIKW